MSGVVTFTNLFPSSVMPGHGLFVRERMQRVVAALGCAWQVVSPVPQVAFFLRQGVYRRWHEVPREERIEGVRVLHPRYRHWPGLSQRRQAAAMAAGALPAVAGLTAGGRCVIDAHYLYPDGVAAAAVAKQLGVPYVLTARGSDLNVLANDRATAAAIADAARGASRRFAVSSALCRRFAELCGMPVELARNGVDLERFALRDRQAARAELGLPVGARLLLGVGRLVPGKGFDVAADALAQLPGDVQLVLVGDGPDRTALAARPRVRCIGSLAPDRVALACAAADLMVLPSEREGWPNVVTEALACGLRVCASRVGGIPEILAADADGRVDPRLGALVPPRDAEALAAAIQGQLAQPDDRAHVRRFAERYGWREPVELLRGAFAALLGGGT